MYRIDSDVLTALRHLGAEERTREEIARALREAEAILVQHFPRSAARIAQDWLRRHQLGEEFAGWVDPTKAPEAE